MVSETPATARLSHVGHRRAPTLSNQIARKDRQTCPGLGGSGLPLPMSWEVTGIRTCLRAGACSSRARHTYLHSLGAHAAPRAAPPKEETRPGPAGAAAAGRQRRRALGHLARQVAAAARRALAPHSPRARGLRGRQKRAPGAALPPCALGGGCSGAPRASGPGGRGGSGGGGAVRCPGLRGARGGCGLRAQRVLRRPSPRPDVGSSSDARCPLPGDNFLEVGARAAALPSAGVVSRRAGAAATIAVVGDGGMGKHHPAREVRAAWP